MATTKLMTAEDLWQMGEDGRFCELIRGELVCRSSKTGEPSPATGNHSQITGMIFAHLLTFTRTETSHDVFESSAGYILARDPDILVAPDVSIVRSDHFPKDGPGSSFIEFVPDIVVDVLSPLERIGQITTRLIIYLNTGVQIVWLVDPEDRTVTVHTSGEPPRTLTTEDEIDGGDVLPGFSVPVAAFFERWLRDAS